MKRHHLLLALLLSLALVPVAAAQATDTSAGATTDAEELSLAARRGDAAKVQTLLEKGVDVNTKFRYDVTALFYACDRGYVDVVKVLLDHGATVNLRDTFYNSRPLDWASSPASVEEPTDAHVEIVKLLLGKGAEGGEGVLLSAARGGNLAMARAVLDAGKVGADALTAALSTATTAKHEAIVEALRAAGAVPPFEVDAATLAAYAGKYRGDSGDLDMILTNGKLYASPGGQRIPLFATDKVTFKPEGFAGIVVEFQLEGGNVTGLILTQGENKTTYKRLAEEK